MKPNSAIFVMHLGMLLIIFGAIAFLISSDSHQVLMRCMVAWSCSSATAIFYAGNSAINRLKEQIRELEKRDHGSDLDVDTDDMFIKI